MIDLLLLEVSEPFEAPTITSVNVRLSLFGGTTVTMATAIIKKLKGWTTAENSKCQTDGELGGLILLGPVALNLAAASALDRPADHQVGVKLQGSCVIHRKTGLDFFRLTVGRSHNGATC